MCEAKWIRKFSFIFHIFIHYSFIYTPWGAVHLIDHIEGDGKSVVGLWVVARHGARAPAKNFLYPFYVVIPQHWPNGLDNLTDKGCHQSYRMGQYIARYAKAKNRSRTLSYTRDLSLLSTNLTRTKASSLAFALGFRSEILRNSTPRLQETSLDRDELKAVITLNMTVWNGNSIDILPTYKDSTDKEVLRRAFTVYNYHACTGLKYYVYLSLMNPKSQIPAFIASNPSFVVALLKYTGYDQTEIPVRANQIEDAIACDRTQDAAFIPTWAKGWLRELKLFSDLSVRSMIKHIPILGYYTSGLLFHHILTEMSAPTVDRKNFVNLIMAHEYILYALMTYLKIDFIEKPAFSSALIFELWTYTRAKLDDKLYVDIYYKPGDRMAMKLVMSNIPLTYLCNNYKITEIDSLTNILKHYCTA